MLFIVVLPSIYVRSTWVRPIRVNTSRRQRAKDLLIFCTFPCSPVIALVLKSMVDGCLMKEAMQ